MSRQGHITIWDVVFCSTIAGVAGAALFAVITDDPSVWARQDGRADWLGFWGAILGALVTGASILVAWRMSVQQLSAQRSAATWDTLRRLHEQLSPQLVGLRDAELFCMRLLIPLTSRASNIELFQEVARDHFGVPEGTLQANIRKAVVATLPRTPPDMQESVEGIINKIYGVTGVAREHERLKAEGRRIPTEGLPDRWRRDANNDVVRILGILESRIAEIESLELIVQDEKARVIDQARIAIKRQRTG